MNSVRQLSTVDYKQLNLLDLEETSLTVSPEYVLAFRMKEYSLLHKKQLVDKDL